MEDAPAARVLVVEDEVVVAMDIDRRLSRLGYVVCGLADTGEEAVALADRTRPDVVLMDIRLPGRLDGVEAAARIRQSLGAPVVFLSAHSDAQTLRRAGEAGPYGYVGKPFEDRELTTALEIALYKSRMERRVAESERWTAMTLAHLGEGVITVDQQGLVRYANPMAATLVGQAAASLLGRPLESVYRTRDEQGGDGERPEDAFRPNALLCRPDGTTIPVSQRHSTLTDDQGGRLGAVVVFRDISRRRNFEEALRASLDDLRHTLEETVNALTVTSETRDPFTAGHQQRVSKLADALAGRIGLTAHQREGVRLAGLVHDIGKIHVPSEILAKPDVLTETERGIVRDHSQVGHDILKDIPFPWPVARMVLEHHERLDGSGYPKGLRGNAILLEARILAVADVVEAMTSHRPYRVALGIEQALAEIRDGRGRLYDADVADACLWLFEQGGFCF